jgi:hypothetical protein
MSKTPPQEGRPTQAGVRIVTRVVLILLSTAILVVLLLALQSGKPIGRGYQGQVEPEEEDPDTPGEIEPIVQPLVVPVHQAELDDAEMMIAIEVDGEHRAYLVQDLSQPGSHVVNDMVAGLPVSITYCDQTDFARVFSDPRTDQPIELRTAGWVDQQLALYVGSSQEKMHLHDDPLIPLDDYPFVRVSFGQWRRQYPDGLVYIGGIDWEADEGKDR